MSAMPVAELLHVPPAGLVLSTVAEPSHTAPAPDMAAGNGSIVTNAVLVQPPSV